MADATLRIADGVALALFVYDVAQAIDLDRAEAAIAAAGPRAPGTVRERIAHPVGSRRTPEYFEFRSAPLRVDLGAEPVAVGGMTTDGRVECTMYDFGAVSVLYRIPVPPGSDLGALLPLADELYEHVGLLADSRRHAEELLRLCGPAAARAGLAPVVEDYVLYHLRDVRTAGGHSAPWPDWTEPQRALLARVLRAERGELSREEISDALWCAVSYSPSDAVVIDWNASVVLQDHAEDVLAVLEFANVELLEMRFLDDRLDGMLDESYDRARARRGGGVLPGSDRDEARRLAALQVDGALLFENVNNALKLLGDQYLARVYRMAAQRLHLPEWDAAILRKLQTVRDLYEKIHDERSTRRMEFLEWIIILLIAVSIIIPFIPGLGGK